MSGNPRLSDTPTPPPFPGAGAGDPGELGPYRILSVIGQGGMGRVYEAEEKMIRRKVALKVIVPELAVHPEMRKRFLAEAQSTAALEHDHIVPIYAVGEAPFGSKGDVVYFAMPLLKGETLEAFLLRGGRLSLTEAVRIGREIAEGLAAAHDRNLIHRDIKPANVFLEGDRKRVRILDFGLARDKSDDMRLTQPGVVIGTPAYMAPEQAEGVADKAGDLFSLGCVLYEITAGVRPFRGDTLMALLTSMATEPPRPPSSWNALMPVTLSDMILSLLKRRPAERRPSTAREVAERLADFQAMLSADIGSSGRVLPTPETQASVAATLAPVAPLGRPSSIGGHATPPPLPTLPGGLPPLKSATVDRAATMRPVSNPTARPAPPPPPPSSSSAVTLPPIPPVLPPDPDPITPPRPFPAVGGAKASNGSLPIPPNPRRGSTPDDALPSSALTRVPFVPNSKKASSPGVSTTPTVVTPPPPVEEPVASSRPDNQNQTHWIQVTIGLVIVVGVLVAQWMFLQNSADPASTRPDEGGVEAHAGNLAVILKDLPPGGRIRLRPGSYAESLVINKPLTLTGPESGGVIFRSLSLGDPALAIRSSGVTVANITFSDGKPTSITVRGSKASAVFRKCKFTGSDGPALALDEGAKVELSDCDISSNKTVGVSLRGNSELTVKAGTSISANGTGIDVRGSKVTLTGVSFAGHTLLAVNATDKATVIVLADCQFEGPSVKASRDSTVKADALPPNADIKAD